MVVNLWDIVSLFVLGKFVFERMGEGGVGDCGFKCFCVNDGWL